MDTNEIFRTALRAEVRESLETQSGIAKSAGLSVAYLNDLIHGRRFGTEAVRRRLALHFGWPHYEGFLNIGRRELGLPLVRETPPARFFRRALFRQHASGRRAWRNHCRD